MEKTTACGFCVNAYVDDELEPDKDLSYRSLGKSESGYRAMLRTGGSRPTMILFEKWDETTGRRLVGCYQPQYCPNCGRKLVENKAPNV